MAEPRVHRRGTDPLLKVGPDKIYARTQVQYHLLELRPYKSGIQLCRCRRHEIVLILYSGLPYKFENLPT